MTNDMGILFLNSNKDTLKNTSVDTHDSGSTGNKYMTESDLEVINFNSVKEKYVEPLHLSEVFKSNDALYLSNNEWYFIEFKNGVIDHGKNYQIKQKIYDSLLIFLDILNLGISYSRVHVNYILVYNEDKDHTCNRWFSKEKLEEDEINYSGSRAYILGRISELGNSTYVQFGLERFKNLYFNNVFTYTKSQFKRFFVDKFSN